MKCHHHECDNSFTPSKPNQRFCSDTCKQKNKNWRMIRGAVIVTAIMTGDRDMISNAIDRVADEYRK